MQNVVLIALVLVIVIFAVYQYNPSVFRFMRRGDGFADMNGKDKDVFAKLIAGMGDAHDDQNSAHGSFPGNTQAAITNSNPNNNPVSNGDPQSSSTYGNNLKNQPEKKEGFADLSSYEGPANFGAAEAPAGCYPRDQLTPAELLPKDMNSIWAEQNPMGPGSLKGKNFLSAGALIGVNTIGQSLRNANLQLRAEPPCPQVQVGPWLQSTIEPDLNRRPLE